MKTANVTMTVLALAALVACRHQEAKPEQAATQATPLAVAAASFETLLDVEESTGKVGYNEDAITPVFSPYTGRAVELMAKPGDTVKAGAPLAVVESAEVLDAASALLVGRADLAKAQATLRQAMRTHDRLKRLVAGDAAAQKDLEQAATDVETARGDVSSAEAQIDAARQRLLNFGRTPEEIERLAATRRTDRGARIVAPIAGQIVARKVGPGQYVRPDNADPMFTIADTSSMWLLAQVYESQAAGVRLGERVSVSVLALPGRTFPAQVVYIAPSVDPATRRVTVRCAVANRGGELKPEMFATFRFERAARQVLMVPRAAIVREGNIDTLWVAGANNRYERRNVTTGAERDGKIEVTSGIKPGERVVVNGALLLANSAKG